MKKVLRSTGTERKRVTVSQGLERIVRKEKKEGRHIETEKKDIDCVSEFFPFFSHRKTFYVNVFCVSLLFFAPFFFLFFSIHLLTLCSSFNPIWVRFELRIVFLNTVRLSGHEKTARRILSSAFYDQIPVQDLYFGDLFIAPCGIFCRHFPLLLIHSFTS